MIRAYDMKFFSLISILFQNGCIDSGMKDKAINDWKQAASENNRNRMSSVLTDLLAEIPFQYIDMVKSLVEAINKDGRKESE